MKEQVLTIQQMIYLQSLGIDTSKAGLFWDYKYGNELDVVKYPERLAKYISNGFGIGAFTLQDILNLLPCHIDGYVLGFNQDYRGQDNNICFMSYTDIDIPDEHLKVIDVSKGGILQASYEMLCWYIINKALAKENSHV